MKRLHWLSDMHKLLRRRTESLPVVAAGAGVKFNWLDRFADQKFKDPGVNRVERVYHYLSLPGKSTKTIRRK